MTNTLNVTTYFKMNASGKITPKLQNVSCKKKNGIQEIHSSTFAHIKAYGKNVDPLDFLQML